MPSAGKRHRSRSTSASASTGAAAGAQQAGWLIAALLATAVLAAALLPVVFNDFTTWDDHQTIAGNWRIIPPSWEGLSAHWRSPHMSLYVPVTYTAWAMVSALAHRATGEASAAWFHAASLAVHILAAVAVCAWVHLLIRSAVPTTGELETRASRSAWNAVAAFLGAAVFAVHPLQVETVAWASGLKDLLMGLLSVLCLHAIALAQLRWDKRGARYGWLATGGGLLLLAMLSKPAAVVVPLMMVPMLWLLRAPGRRIALIVLPGLLLALPFIVLGRLAQPETDAVYGGPLWARPLIAGDAWAFYLRKLAWPLGLAPDYGRAPETVLRSTVLWWAWIIPAALAVVLWWRRDRMPLVAAGAAMAAIVILPVSGLVTFEFQSHSTVADHYAYLALAGVALAVAGGAGHITVRRRRLLIVAAPTVLLVWLTLDWRQVRNWTDTRSLFTHTLAVNPRSHAAHTNLATLAIEEGRLEEARKLVDAALHLRADDVHARVTLGNVLYLQGDRAGAEQAYREVLRGVPNDPVALSALGGLLAEQGRDEALSLLERAVAVDPDLAPAHLNLGTLLAMRGHLAEAEHHLRWAIRLDGRDARPLMNLAIILHQQGRREEALQLQQRAREINPRFAPARQPLN